MRKQRASSESTRRDRCVHLLPVLRSLLHTTLAASLTASSILSALANPTNGNVVGGQASITGGAGLTTITQDSHRAIINWESFSIDPGELTHFIQNTGQSAVALNRAIGNPAIGKLPDPSVILGQLQANGNVWLINQNGILFGADAKVDVHGLLATTADIADSDFMAGNYDFSLPSPNPDAGVVNEGTITIGEHGLAGLVAPHVRNSGLISGHLGQVVLAGTPTFALDFYGDGLIQFEATSEVTEGLHNGEPIVDHDGTISVEGGKVLITADAAAGVVDDVINMTGIVDANSFEIEQGTIVLDGGDEGIVRVAGALDASGSDSGEIGGTVKVLGEKVGLFDEAKIDVSGAHGGGEALVGGNYQGKGAERTSNRAYVAKEASIDASATTLGDGGRVIVWADQLARFEGTITARGGKAGGDGGFVETSSKESIQITGDVDAGATFGKPGSWLLDPGTITIGFFGDDRWTGTGTENDPFSSVVNPALLPNVVVEDALVESDVYVRTNGDIPNGEGNISVGSGPVDNFQGITALPDSVGSLFLEAHTDIVLDAPIDMSESSGDLVLRADGAGTPDVPSDGSGAIRGGTVIMGDGALSMSAGSGISLTVDQLANVSARTETGGIVLEAVGDARIINVGDFNGIAGVTAGAGDVTIDAILAFFDSSLQSSQPITTGEGSVNIVVEGFLRLAGQNASISATDTVEFEAGDGIVIDGISVDANGADIVMTGNGSGAVNGISVVNGGLVRTRGSGSIRLTGTGGTVGAGNVGVIVAGDGSIVQAENGDITLTGLGGGNEASRNNDGISIFNGGAVVATGNGNITFDGTAGTGTTDNQGIAVGNASEENALPRVSAQAGSIAMRGTANGSQSDTGVLGNIGILLFDGAVVSAGNAVTLEGTGATGGAGVRSSNVAFAAQGSNAAPTIEAGGDLLLNANPDIVLDAANLAGTQGNVIAQAENDILVNSPLSFSSQTAGERVVFQAGRTVSLSSALTTQGSDLWLEADSPHVGGESSADGLGSLELRAPISTNGNLTGGAFVGEITLIAGDFEINAAVDNGDSQTRVAFSASGDDLEISNQPGEFTTSISPGEIGRLGGRAVFIGDASSAGTDGLGTGSQRLTAGNLTITDPIAVPAETESLWFLFENANVRADVTSSQRASDLTFFAVGNNSSIGIDGDATVESRNVTLNLANATDPQDFIIAGQINGDSVTLVHNDLVVGGPEGQLSLAELQRVNATQQLSLNARSIDLQETLTLPVPTLRLVGGDISQAASAAITVESLETIRGGGFPPAVNTVTLLADNNLQRFSATPNPTIRHESVVLRNVIPLQLDEVRAGSIDIAAQGSLSIAGPIDATGNLSLSSGGNINQSGDILGSGSILVQSGDSLVIDASITATERGRISILADQIQLNGVVSAEGPDFEDSSNTSILVVANESFGNSAGRDAVEPGEGRFLVYSVRPSDDQPGGLETVSSKFAVKGPIEDIPPDTVTPLEENFFVYQFLEQLIFSAIKGPPSEYGLDPFATDEIGNYYDVTYSDGPLPDDAYDGEPTLIAHNDQGNVINFANGDAEVSKSPYDIDIEGGDNEDGGVSSRFETVFVDCSDCLEISPAPLRAKVQNDSRAYRVDNPKFDADYTGFRLGQTEKDLGEQTFESDAVFESEVGDGSNPNGTYAIRLLSFKNPNYTVDLTVNEDARNISGELAITPAPLRAKVQNDSREYGVDNPQFDADYTGFRPGQTEKDLGEQTFESDAMLESEVGDGSNPNGTYAIRLLSFKNPNYTVDPTVNEDARNISGELAITPAPLQADVRGDSREYGLENPEFDADYDITGFRLGQSEADLGQQFFETDAVPESNVGGGSNPNGTYPILLVRFENQNYTIDSTVNSKAENLPGELTIVSVPLTITADDLTLTQDAFRTLASLQMLPYTASYTGFRVGDSESIVEGLEFETIVQPISPTNIYTIRPFGATAKNYVTKFVDGDLIVGDGLEDENIAQIQPPPTTDETFKLGDVQTETKQEQEVVSAVPITPRRAPEGFESYVGRAALFSNDSKRPR